MDEQFQIQFMPSDSMLSIRSPLRYKYKPTIRYSVELYRNPGSYAGRLKVQFRTQNLQQVACIHRAFGLTGANDRMQFIDEQDNLSFALADLFQNRLQTFLKSDSGGNL